MINKNYPTAFSNKIHFIKLMYSELGEEINYTAMWDMFAALKMSLKDSIRRSLIRLNSMDLITFDELILFKKELTLIPSNLKEELIVNEYSDTVIRELGVEKNHLQYNDRLRNEYYDKMNEFVKTNLGYDSMFVGYGINLNEDKLKNNILDEENEKNEILSSILMNRTYESLKKRRENCILDYPDNEEPNSNWDQYILDKHKDSYLNHSEYALNMLCDLNYADIRDKIKKQDIKKGGKEGKSKLSKEFIANQPPEDRKIWEYIFSK